jgi:putative flavoprotein involved in K+ transport
MAKQGRAGGSYAGDEVLDVVVIGGGQAGLAMAWHLARQHLRFVVLEAGPEPGHTWRSRWDSLTLFTPARYDALPGMPFPGPPDTYPAKELVAAYLNAYAATFNLPVRLNTRVTALIRTAEGFEAHTDDGVFRARQAVVATGPFQVPYVPPTAQRLDGSVTRLHSAGYRNPRMLPPGPVLVVGGGNSGFQIAEELAATRQVDLSIATTAPVLPQRLAGKDLFWWLTRFGLMRVTAGSRLGRRMSSREFVIGGSRRRLQAAGVRFRPAVAAADGRTVRFADGTSLDVEVVIWATGYRSDYSWIHIPGVARDGQVIHCRGVTDVPGLYFVGLSWQHTRGSALLGFVNDDAAVLAGHIAARHQIGDLPSPGVQAGRAAQDASPAGALLTAAGGGAIIPVYALPCEAGAFGAWRDHSYAGGAARTVRVTVPEGGSPWPCGSSCLHPRCGWPGLPPGWAPAGTV